MQQVSRRRRIELGGAPFRDGLPQLFDQCAQHNHRNTDDREKQLHRLHAVSGRTAAEQVIAMHRPEQDHECDDKDRTTDTLAAKPDGGGQQQRQRKIQQRRDQIGGRNGRWRREGDGATTHQQERQRAGLQKPAAAG